MATFRPNMFPGTCATCGVAVGKAAGVIRAEGTRMSKRGEERTNWRTYCRAHTPADDLFDAAHNQEDRDMSTDEIVGKIGYMPGNLPPNAPLTGERRVAIRAYARAQGIPGEIVNSRMSADDLRAVYNGFLTGLEAVQKYSEPVAAPARETVSANGHDDTAHELARVLAKIAAGSKAPVDAETVRAIVREELANVEPREVKIVCTPAAEVRVDEHTHECFAELCKNIALGIHTFLVGPAGSGKSHVAEQAARALNRPFASISCSEGLSESKLLGWLIPTGEGGRFEYVASDFVTIYENGGVFCLDEIDRADANTMTVLNQALANGGFYLPQRKGNTYVKRHPDFVCVAAGNTYGHGNDVQYVGANRLDAATLDRFRAGIIVVGYDAKLEEQLVHKDILTWGRRIRANIERHKMRRIMSTRVLREFSKKIAAGFTIADCERTYFADWTADERSKAIQ